MKATRPPTPTHVLLSVASAVLALSCPTFTPAQAECPPATGLVPYLWHVDRPAEMQECRDDNGSVTDAYIEASSFGPQVLEGGIKRLTIKKSKIVARSALQLAEIGHLDYDVTSLGRHCDGFFEFYVAPTVCGKDQKRQSNAVIPQWPTDRTEIRFVSAGIDFRDTTIVGNKEVHLDGTILDGDLTFSRIPANDGPIRLELTDCVINGNLILNDVKKATILIRSCLILGDVRVHESDFTILSIKWSGIMGNVEVRRVANLGFVMAQVDVLGNLTLDRIRFDTNNILNNVRFGKQVVLTAVDQSPIDGHKVRFFAEGIELGAGARVENSIVVRDPAEMFPGAAVNNVTVLR